MVSFIYVAMMLFYFFFQTVIYYNFRKKIFKILLGFQPWPSSNANLYLHLRLHVLVLITAMLCIFSVCSTHCQWWPALLWWPQREPQISCRVCILSPRSVDFPHLHWRVSLSTLDYRDELMLFYLLIRPSVSSEEDEKETSFVGTRQPTWVQQERLCGKGVWGRKGT